jgi:hypothetical protein
MICTSEVNTITIISILGIIIYLVLNNKNKSDIQYEKKIKLLDQLIKESKKDIQQKIKVKEDMHQEYASADTVYVTPKLQNKSQSEPQVNRNLQEQKIDEQTQEQQQIQYLQSMIPRFMPQYDPVIERDRAVIQDQLYPPLGRTERPIFDQIVSRFGSGLLSYPTRGSPDTFRMIAYLVNNTDKRDTWKLFGRQKYPGSSQGEYYAIPVDDRKSDMKITIKDDMMPNEKIRDIYGLPNEVTIKSPLFSSESYKVIELDKADLTSPYF